MDNDAITYHPVTLFQNFLHGANVSKRRISREKHWESLSIEFDPPRNPQSVWHDGLRLLLSPIIPRVHVGRTSVVARSGNGRRRVFSLYLSLGTAHSCTGGKISMAKRKGGRESGRKVERPVRRSEGVVVSRADSYESLNRCFTMAFCFACFIEQRADIHVNLALSQSARTGREPSHNHPPRYTLFFLLLASFFFLCYSLWISAPPPFFIKLSAQTSDGLGGEGRGGAHARQPEKEETLFYRVMD